MAVFQPLYFGGGQYTPEQDRKLISSIVGVDSSGNRLFGVIPEDLTTYSMTPSISAGKLSVTEGMCIVSEDTTEDSTSGGYIAGIVSGTTETYTPATNSTGSTVTDSLYAVVDPTQYVITAKQQTTTTAVRITTSTNHGFVEGRTVVITGLGNLYDGTYTIGVGNIVSNTIFQLSTPTIATTDASAVTISATAYKGTTAKIITAKALVGGVARLTSASHGFSVNDTITIVGVDSTFDGTFRISNINDSNTFDYVINKVKADVASYASPTTVSTSSIARASSPFYLAAERGSGTTLSTKSKVLLATYSVATGGNTPTNVVDKRKYVSALGGTVLYTTAGGTPSSSPGRFRYNVTTNVLEYYNGTAWTAPIELASSPTDTTSTKASRGDHTHSGFSSTTHTHSYEPYVHTHTLSEITDYSAGANQEKAMFTPVSTGDYTNTMTINQTSGAWTYFTPGNIQVTVNSTNACRALIIYSAKIDSISGLTSGNITCAIAPRVQSNSTANGTVVISEEVVGGTSSHQMGALDGTSWSYGSDAWAGLNTNNKYMGQYPALLGTRVVNLPAGTNRYISLRFYLSSGATAPATVVFSNPTIKVIPLTAL